MAQSTSKSFLGRETREYVDFIIGVDDSGKTITYTSNPSALANFFGANPNAPNFLTQVHFRRDVLDKYYQKPSTYSVKSGILHGGHEWGLPMDNNHEDKVCAWLGDLGRIPHDEQLHWRAHNIPPSGTLSETFYANQILATPTDSNRPDHLFMRSYDKLQKVWGENLGWSVLVPLSSDDSHHLQTLRIPSTEEQREFDELVLSLTKVLIDSINEKKLKEVIPELCNDNSTSGLNVLERALQSIGIENFSIHIHYLRKLQALRSAGVAHRKGKRYEKLSVELGIGSKSFRVVFEELLEGGTDYLDFLTSVANDCRMHSS